MLCFLRASRNGLVWAVNVVGESQHVAISIEFSLVPGTVGVSAL